MPQAASLRHTTFFARVKFGEFLHSFNRRVRQPRLPSGYGPATRHESKSKAPHANPGVMGHPNSYQELSSGPPAPSEPLPGKTSENVPSGTCEEIAPRNFSGDPKCIPTSQTLLIRVLNDKFLGADSGEIANLHFFTRSCPRFPVPGFPLISQYTLGALCVISAPRWLDHSNP